MDVQQDHRDAFVDAMERADTPQQEEDFMDELERIWKPQYEEAAEQALRDLEEEAARMAQEQFGSDDLPVDLESETLEREARRIGREAHDDAEHAFDAQYSMNVQDPDIEDSSIDVLAASTLAALAGAATTEVFNEGREAAVDSLVAQMPEDDIKATRTAVMDGATCEQCERLHDTTYLYDSENYHRNKPPLRCVWPPNCRCTMEYSVPVDVDV